MGGNENLGRAGALIVAHENVRKRLSTDQVVEFFKKSVPATARAGLPVVTFTRDLAFHLGARRSIEHFGRELAAGRPIELLDDEVLMLEVYAASETGITAFTVPGEEGMRFWECYDVFYELETPEGEVITAQELASEGIDGLQSRVAPLPQETSVVERGATMTNKSQPWGRLNCGLQPVHEISYDFGRLRRRRRRPWLPPPPHRRHRRNP